LDIGIPHLPCHLLYIYMVYLNPLLNGHGWTLSFVVLSQAWEALQAGITEAHQRQPAPGRQ
jgi:hypothetical protein